MTTKTKKSTDTVFFSMEYQIGNGKDWTMRKASVHNNHVAPGGFVLFTTTLNKNHEPIYYADMGEAILAGMAFAQKGKAPHVE